jgi:hypothetical protein
MVATGIGKAGFLPYAQVGPFPLALMSDGFLIFSFSSFGHSAADLQKKLFELLKPI